MRKLQFLVLAATLLATPAAQFLASGCCAPEANCARGYCPLPPLHRAHASASAPTDCQHTQAQCDATPGCSARSAGMAIAPLVLGVAPAAAVFPGPAMTRAPLASLPHDPSPGFEPSLLKPPRG